MWPAFNIFYNLDCYKFWLMSTYIGPKYRLFCFNPIFSALWAVYTIGLQERGQILSLIAEVLKAFSFGEVSTLWSVHVITLRKISKTGAIGCKILRLKCRKFDFCWADQTRFRPCWGSLTALPWPPSWCLWVNPLSKNPISLDSSGLAFTRPQYPQAQHPYLKILSYGPAC